MRVGIIGDVHWNTYSSILRQRGDKYSVRLEGLINTIQWVEDYAVEHSLDSIIMLGDFFDRADINSEEISALNEIKWSNIPHTFLVGNHEAGRSNLVFSSAQLLKLFPNFNVIDIPTRVEVDYNHVFYYLPFIHNSEDKVMNKYIHESTDKKVIVFSHNDIKGVQMGKFLSQEGFEVSDIESNCNLFVNGHLHNSSLVTSKIFNIGNITGQNFGEDARIYPHQMMILDTSDSSINFIDNPYAFNFYGLDMVHKDVSQIKQTLSNLKNNSIVALKVSEKNSKEIKDWLTSCSSSNIISYRVMIEPEVAEDEVTTTLEENISLDYMKKFQEYVIDNISSDALTLEELSSILV